MPGVDDDAHAERTQRAVVDELVALELSVAAVVAALCQSLQAHRLATLELCNTAVDSTRREHVIHTNIALFRWFSIYRNLHN